MKTKAFFCLVAGLLISALAPDAFAANVTWTGGGDQSSWSDARNWSSGALPGPSDDVTIGGVSGNPTVQITTAVGIAQINSLTSSEPINISGGVLQAATTIQLSQVLTLSGGTVKGGAITGTSIAAVSANSGTLDGVTLGLITTLPANAVLNVKNGLTLANAKLILAPAQNYNGYSAKVYFLGTQTLGGTGEVIFAGGGYTDNVYVQGADDTVAGGATLTIGAGILVHGTQGGSISTVHAYDSVINQGTINADTSGTTITLTGAGSNSVFQNSGIIEDTAGTLSLSNFTIRGGTPGKAAITGSTTLDGVTLSGDLTVQNDTSIYVKNGLTLNNAKLILIGYIIYGGYPYQSSVYFVGTQAIGGTGEIIFGGSGNDSLYVQGTDDTATGGATLTIGANVTIHGSYGGSINAVHAYDSIVNQGTINADTNGANISFIGIGSNNVFKNLGTIEATAGSIYLNNWALANSGSILKTNGGVLREPLIKAVVFSGA